MLCRALARGFSLIEVIMFILVVSVALVSLIKVFEVANVGSADPVLRRQSLAIAQALLEEISYKAYANPTGGYDDGNTATAIVADRAKFDDLMDYNGLALNGITNLAGGAIAGLGGYVVRVAVAAGAFGGVPASAGYRISVTVTDPRGQAITLDGYRANY